MATNSTSTSEPWVYPPLPMTPRFVLTVLRQDPGFVKCHRCGGDVDEHNAYGKSVGMDPDERRGERSVVLHYECPPGQEQQ